MFAFALFDRLENKLLLSRDRIGEKPLYYGFINNTFFFGSELKSFSPHPKWNPSISKFAIKLFLQYSYIPSPYSIYEDIFKLNPATYIEYDLEKKNFTNPQEYWSLSEVVSKGNSNRTTLSEKEIVDHTEYLLTESISKRLISDIEVGSNLSGGIDSSLIAILAQKSSVKPINTFTIGVDSLGVDNGNYDEAPFAKAISQEIGSNHNELYITQKEACSLISSLSSIYDEPFADSSQLPTILLSRFTKQKVSVALSGDGGDEIFCGYNRYNQGYNLFRLLNKFPLSFRPLLSQLINNFPANYVDSLVQLFYKGSYPGVKGKLEKFSEISNMIDKYDFYHSLISCFKNPNNLTTFEDDFSYNRFQNLSHFASSDFREIMMQLDTLTYLPDDILVKVDRASMSTGLELRLPYLDHDLIEWAWKIPLKAKIKRNKSKWILRQILYKYIPKNLIERPKKGFSIPVYKWLRGELKEWTTDMLSERSISKSGILDYKEVSKLLEEHLSYEKNNHYKIWNLVCLQDWFLSGINISR